MLNILKFAALYNKFEGFGVLQKHRKMMPKRLLWGVQKPIKNGHWSARGSKSMFGFAVGGRQVAGGVDFGPKVKGLRD